MAPEQMHDKSAYLQFRTDALGVTAIVIRGMEDSMHRTSINPQW